MATIKLDILLGSEFQIVFQEGLSVKRWSPDFFFVDSVLKYLDLMPSGLYETNHNKYFFYLKDWKMFSLLSNSLFKKNSVIICIFQSID